MHVRQGSGALLLLDVDGTRTLRAVLPAALAAAALDEVGRRLAEIVGAGALERLGPDTFAVRAPAGDAVALARRLLRRLAEPLAVDGYELSLTACAGIVAGGDSPAAAYHALARAKRRAPSAIHVLTAAERDEAAAAERLAAELHGALRRRELRLHYQPIVDLADRRVVGFEALVRWEHPELGLLAPDRFLGVAERVGAIARIGEWVLAEACREARRWVALTPGGVPALAVNLAPADVVDEGFPERVARTLAETGLPPGRLLVELTEGSVVRDVELARDALRAVHALGVMVAIDDFGTGYSTLAQVRELQSVGMLKLDRSFVRGLTGESEDRVIVAAMSAMAGDLGLATVAEGIETPEQIAAARDLGCTFGQGYAFSRPVPPDEIAALLAAHQSSARLRPRERRFARGAPLAATA